MQIFPIPPPSDPLRCRRIQERKFWVACCLAVWAAPFLFHILWSAPVGSSILLLLVALSFGAAFPYSWIFGLSGFYEWSDPGEILFILVASAFQAAWLYWIGASCHRRFGLAGLYWAGCLVFPVCACAHGIPLVAAYIRSRELRQPMNTSLVPPLAATLGCIVLALILDLTSRHYALRKAAAPNPAE